MAKIINKILWIAPNLNHYKARFLNKLANDDTINITVFAGSDITSEGHQSIKQNNIFKLIVLKANKKNFYHSIEVYKQLLLEMHRKSYDTVLMPLELKHTPILFFLFFFKFFFRFNLISYNHAGLKIAQKKYLPEQLILKFYYSLYNKIIFYTENSYKNSLKLKVIKRNKAYFANNTLDTDHIWGNYNFTINNSETKTILFIGRLIPSKRLDLLFKYYYKLKIRIPLLKLMIIGDGPERNLVKNEVDRNKNITWYGAVVDEKKICVFMEKSHIVFIPGHTGLSIVHAFCYGNPFITLSTYKNQPPEIGYLKNNNNGLILSGHIDENVNKITELLTNKEKYKFICNNAYKTAKELTIQKWCEQIKFALFDKG